MVKLSSRPEDQPPALPLMTLYYHADGSMCPVQSTCFLDWHECSVVPSNWENIMAAKQAPAAPVSSVSDLSSVTLTQQTAQSSVQITQNSKGEPLVEVKVYDDDVMRGVRTAYRAYTQAWAYLLEEEELPDEEDTTH